MNKSEPKKVQDIAPARKSACRCACHDNKPNKKPYLHDTQCCEKMYGFLHERSKPTEPILSKSDSFKIRTAPRDQAPNPPHAKHVAAIKDHLKSDGYELADYEIGHLASMMAEVERAAEERVANKMAVDNFKALKEARAEEREKIIARMRKTFEHSSGGGNWRRTFAQLINHLTTENHE